MSDRGRQHSSLSHSLSSSRVGSRHCDRKRHKVHQRQRGFTARPRHHAQERSLLARVEGDDLTCPPVEDRWWRLSLSDDVLARLQGSRNTLIAHGTRLAIDPDDRRGALNRQLLPEGRLCWRSISSNTQGCLQTHSITSIRRCLSLLCRLHQLFDPHDDQTADGKHRDCVCCLIWRCSHPSSSSRDRHDPMFQL